MKALRQIIALITFALAASMNAHSAMVPLDEDTLRDTVGQADASVNVGELFARLGSLGDGLSLGGMVVASLTRDEFTAEMRSRGFGQPDATLYDGRDVTRLGFEGQPFDMQTDIGRLLNPFGNVQTHIGALSISAMDLRGTVLWIWGH